MIMGLCLLVYSLGQRALRQALERAKQTIDNQLGKPTATPTLRWVFQCFMSIHLVTVAQTKLVLADFVEPMQHALFTVSAL